MGFLALLGLSFRQFLRHRILYLWLLFGLIFLGVSLVLSDLAVVQKERVLIDIGLATIELFVLLVVLFFSVQLISEDQASGFLYLIFARPVSALAYIFGKFFGLILSALLATTLLGLVFFILLQLQQIAWQPLFFWVIVSGFCKTVVMAAFALFFSLLFTSQPVAFVATLMMYVLGHLHGSLHFVYSYKGTKIVQNLVKIFFLFVPNLGKYNIKDFFHEPHFSLFPFLFFMAHHTLIFVFFLLLASAFLFYRKEI